MSDPVQLAIVAAVVAFFGGLPSTIAAIAAFLQSRRAANHAAAAQSDLKQIRVSVDGRLTQLIAALEKNAALEVSVAHGAGVEAGIAQEKKSRDVFEGKGEL